MVKHIRDAKPVPSDRLPKEPTLFDGGRRSGKFLYLIAKIQADLPLSVLDRDIILQVLRKAWLTPKEHAAFLRQAELRQIDSAKALLKYAKTVNDPAAWFRLITGRKSIKAVKQFEKRERKNRR